MNRILRKVSTFGLLFFALFLALGILAACDGDFNPSADVSYTVTVLMPDDSPVSGAEVGFWANDTECGKATTNSEGVATASLPGGEYEIRLSSLPAGYTAGQAKTNRLGTPLTVTLREEMISHSVTVTLSDGTAASGAKVTWRNGDNTYTATTNTNGVATKEVKSGSYTVSATLGETYGEASVTVSASNTAATVTLASDSRVEYKVTVVTEGGLHYPNINVYLFDGDNVADYATTNEKGEASFLLLPKEYSVRILGYPNGYSYTEQTTDLEGSDVTLTMKSALQKGAPTSDYVIGSIMCDFTVTTYNGVTVTLSELLKEKKAVMLNFWYTTCSWCDREFPLIQSVYTEYSDVIEIVALDPFDSESDIGSYATQKGLTFPMAQDTAGVVKRSVDAYGFYVTGYPTTAIIDRYGAVAFIDSGAILEETTWISLFEKFTADNYKQTFVPGESQSGGSIVEMDVPDVEMPESDLIGEAVNNTQSGFNATYYTEEGDDSKYVWPWVISEKDGSKVIVPSNSGHQPSYAFLYADITVTEAQANKIVFAFDYFLSTETEKDFFYVFIDGLLLHTYSGVASEWQTCYAYVPIAAGTYTMAFVYMKDVKNNAGDDTVYVKNMRFMPVSEIGATTDILRYCVTGYDEEAGGFTQYTDVIIGDDGYYHVGTKNGPLVFASLLSGTPWSKVSISEIFYDEEKYPLSLRYDMNGDGRKEDCSELVEDYIALASRSEYYGFVPVNEELKRLIDFFMKDLVRSIEYDHVVKANEWLEVCVYYSRYLAYDDTQSPAQVPNPVIGLAMQTALPAVLGKNEFSVDRIYSTTNGLVYRFVPDETAVYRFYGASEDESTNAWLYDDRGIEKGLIVYNGDDIFPRKETDDSINFNFYVCLEANATYFIEVGYYFRDVLGSYDFYIVKMGATHTELEACAPGMYTGILDDEGNLTTAVVLNSISVALGEDGYYHAVNEDGTLGSYIYVDFKYPTRPYSKQSLTELISTYIMPDGETKTFHPFDFTQKIVYVYDDDGWPTDWSIEQVTGGVDYTARMLEIAETADDDGFVIATQELVDILTLLAERDLFGLENDWLRLCYYYHTYSVN